MLIERSQLESRKMSELRVLMAEMGGEPSQPTETKEMLIDRLLLQSAKQPESNNPEIEAKIEDKKAESCTIDQVIKAVNPYILRGMKVFHDKESNSWLFRIQMKSTRVRDANTGEMRLVDVWRDDSGTLFQSIAIIKRCANVLMQGAPNKSEIEKPFNPADSYTAVA